MKRVLALLLSAVMLMGVLASCTTLAEGDKGMIIDIYLTAEVLEFDPAHAYNDDGMVKVLDLIYEGLTNLDEKGKWEKALMDEYKLQGNDEDGWYLLITLNSTKWSDGRTVQAEDFVFAWKRIMDPSFPCEAASLLYCLKNGLDVKMGDASVDDLGIIAVDTYTLKIEFEKKPDLNAFFTATASTALVPLREDQVSRDEDWARQATTVVCSGPFNLKAYTYGREMVLERNSYYYLDVSDMDQPQDTYVIPYRLITNYDWGYEDAQLKKFNEGKLFYLGDIPLENRAEYKDRADVTDEMATYSYVFNTENELFDDARVRRALSMAIDRNELVNIITYAKAATALVPYKVFETKAGTSFRDKGGDILSSTADVEGAKALLKEAGVNGGSFAISIRQDTVDRAVAKYVKSVWEDLGFDVKVTEIRPVRVDSEDKVAYVDVFTQNYMNGEFDVIVSDMQMVSPDAFTALAPFALKFSGNGVDMDSETYDLYGHVSGYQNEAYDALIQKAYEADTAADRAAALHEAEALLLSDMPVVPLFFMQDGYLAHEGLSDYKSTYFANRDFKRMQLKNYTDYLPEEEE